MSKVLVTGGAGFIGSHIVSHLIDKGDEVIIVDNLSTSKREAVHPSAGFYELDINDPKLKEIFEKERPDKVCHLAASTNVRKSVADPLFDARVNVMGMINLLECCRQYGVKKFVFSSTGGALYGDTNILPTPETHPTKPISPYGIDKLTGENYLYYYNKIHKLPVTILRYSNVYGPGQDRKGEGGVVAIFIKNLMENKESTINGTGEQTRDFIYVGDIANANILSLDQESDDIHTYNISTGEQTSVNKLFDLLAKGVGSSAGARHGEANPGEINKSALDTSKIKRELNWNIKYNLEEGLNETVKYFKSL